MDHMQVCTSLQIDNHASTPPLIFLQARCPSCRPTNSVKALTDTLIENEAGSQRPYNCAINNYKKLCFHRRTVRCAMSIKILSTVLETSCTTNPQQTEANGVTGLQWLTCSKQPWLIDCRMSLTNWTVEDDEFCCQCDWLATAKFSNSGVWHKAPGRSTWFLEIPKFPHNIEWDRWKEAYMKKQLNSYSRFNTTPACDRQTDRQTDTGRQQIPR